MKDDPIIDFAFAKIADVNVRDNFLALMAIFIVAGDVHELAVNLGIKDDDPVWPFISDFLKQEYNVDFEAMVASLKP